MHARRDLSSRDSGEPLVDDLPQGQLHRQHPAARLGHEQGEAAERRRVRATGRLSDAEYDHLLSLQLGGDPNDSRNLWLEPPDPGHKPGTGVNNKKDPVETKLHTAVCSGQVTLAAAQRAIASDWTTALSKLGLS